MQGGLALMIAVGTLFSTFVAADPHNYIQAGLGDVVVACVGATIGGSSYNVGGVCDLPAGHVRPNSLGRATLSISDLSQNPTSGWYCQDLNVDGLCGGPGGEVEVAFCGSLVIDKALDWNVALSIEIKVHGPVFGSPVLTACAGGGPLHNPSFGTIGSVTHS